MNYIFTSLLIVLCSQISFAKSQEWQQATNKLISSVLGEVNTSKENFGIWVKYKENTASLNSDRQFVPASLSKIPTALTVANEKSMDDYFHTWLYKVGDIKDGVLNGDLYLKGGGDPSFVSESMWLMIQELKRSDIKKIKGQLYVDETYFDTDYYSEGRQKRRVDRAYDAPVSALSFNWNAISIYVRPGDKLGAPARIYTEPEIPLIKIVNKTKTTSSHKDSLRVDRSLNKDEIILTVTGNISQKTEEKAFYKSIGDAALWTGANFKEFLNRSGIEYSGSIKKQKVPASANQLVEFDSWDMARILAALSKFSNNFVAEMLTKQLGKTENKEGNIDDGLKKITDFLAKKGWKTNEYEFINPSGFTRVNKLRPDKLGELLAQSLNNFNTSPEFLSSLPISGTDGTLKKRMGQVLRGKVRAKTGYLSGASGLAGFLEPKSGGEPITFVFFYNGPSKYDWEVRDIFDKLLWRLYQGS